MNRHTLHRIATASVALAAALAFTPAQAAFTGATDGSHWTPSTTGGGNGSAALAADGSTLTLVSSDSPDFSFSGPSTTSYAITFAADTTLVFDWSYTTADENGAMYDPFGWTLAGTSTQATDDNAWIDPQSGHVTLSAHAGDTFSFWTASADSAFGASTAVVSNFSAVSAVPEPASTGLMASGLVALAGLAARRRRR